MAIELSSSFGICWASAAVRTTNGGLSALRFLYKRTLRRRDLALDDLVFPKVPHKLPIVLSQEEVARLIDAAPNRLYAPDRCAASCSMSCREVFPASATSAGSPTADEPAYCHSAAPGSTGPLLLKCLLSQHRLYGTACTAMGSCTASDPSRPRSSLSNERSSMLLTRHKVWISTATIACFPTRPLHVCLQTEHSLVADHLPTVSSYANSSSAPSTTPSQPIDLTRHPALPAALLPRTIETP
jgi:hypothetical protein